MKDGQTATITANLDGDVNEGTAKITADYVIALMDNIWTYSESTYTVEATEFADGDTVYVKVTDTETKGGAKPIDVENNTKKIQYPLTSPIVIVILSILGPS